MNILILKYDLRPTLHTEKGTYYRIHINRKDLHTKLRLQIKPHFVKSMLYKIEEPVGVKHLT